MAFRAHRLGPNERGLELVQQVVLDRAGDRGERAVRQQRVRERPEGHTREVAPVPVRETLGTAHVGVLGVAPPAQVALLDALLALALRPSLEPGRIGFDAVGSSHGEWKKRDGERERERGEGVGRARNVSERKQKSADRFVDDWNERFLRFSDPVGSRERTETVSRVSTLRPSYRRASSSTRIFTLTRWPPSQISASLPRWSPSATVASRTMISGA